MDFFTIIKHWIYIFLHKKIKNGTIKFVVYTYWKYWMLKVAKESVNEQQQKHIQAKTVLWWLEWEMSPMDSGIWMLGPLLLALFNGVMETSGTTPLLDKHITWNGFWKFTAHPTCCSSFLCFLCAEEVWSVSVLLLTPYNAYLPTMDSIPPEPYTKMCLFFKLLLVMEFIIKIPTIHPHCIIRPYFFFYPSTK